MGFLDNMRVKLGNAIDRHRTVFDPTLLGKDPLLTKTEWSPLMSRGINFRSHTLRVVSPSRIELRPSFSAKTFIGLFAIFGFGVFVVPFQIGLKQGVTLPMLFPFLFGIPIVSVGFWFLRRLTVLHVFDKCEGYAWSGSVSPSEDLSLVHSGKAVSLSDIHAVQLISETITTQKHGTFESIEINLVLQDGSRRHIVDHGGKGIHKDAEQLATFLGVPVWNKNAARRPFDPSRDRSFTDALSGGSRP